MIQRIPVRSFYFCALLIPVLIGEVGCAKIMKGGRSKSVVTDTLKKAKGDTKDYNELLKDAKTEDGLFKVHQVKGDYYFEIPLKYMGKDMLLVNKISSVPLAINEAGLNKGMNYENKVIQFYHNKSAGTIWVKTNVPQVESPAGDAITRSVKDNFTASVIETFKIESYSADSSAVVIKVNKVFDGTEKSFNDVFSNIGLGTSPKTSLSSIEHIKSFQRNLVVRSLLSTTVTEGQTSMPVSIAVTTNLLLLPEKPMTPRFADDRVGFFTTPRWYFSDDQHQMERRNLITRWNLEPRPEDRERYKKGALVEPAKPIVFYIDPATPPKWRKYIIDGVYDWQAAFERAGFKNAIIAKEVTDTANFDIDDVNYSVVTYAASPKSNAMGPSVVDPRSGEIIESDVIWWHNVMTSVQTWMRVQTGIIDTGARANRLSDERMGNAIRFVSSHEIGHTLGLKHNMGASTSFPVDSLRSPYFTKRMGGTASSIMDYARFNYVAQPGDNVEDITPQIGEYDKYAIAWGYRWLGADNPHAELPALKAWVKEKENDPLYRYGEQQDPKNIIDPRSQSEDIGDNAVTASQYGLKNLKRLIPQISTWAAKDGEDYYNAGKLYMAVINQWSTYADHVISNIGGCYLENPVAGDKKNTYTPVPLNMQQQALNYVQTEIMAMPEWLFNAELLKKTFPIQDSPLGPFEYGPYNVRRAYQYSLLYSLLSDERLLRMTEMELLFGKDKVLTVAQLLKATRGTVFKPTLAGKNLSITDRMLQQNYVDALLVSADKLLAKVARKNLQEVQAFKSVQSPFACDYGIKALTEPKTVNETSLRNIFVTSMARTSDVAVEKRGELLRIKDLLEKYKNTGDESTQGHYQDLIMRINQSLKLM